MLSAADDGIAVLGTIIIIGLALDNINLFSLNLRGTALRLASIGVSLSNHAIFIVIVATGLHRGFILRPMLQV